MEGLAEWHVPSGGVVQPVSNAERAGRSQLTLDLDDLERELAAIAGRGLDIGVDDTTSDKVLIAEATNPEGNAITLVQQR